MEELQVCRTTERQELTLYVLLHPKTIQFGHRGKQPSIHAELLLESKLFAIRLKRRCPRGGQHIIDVEYLLALLNPPPLSYPRRKRKTSEGLRSQDKVTWNLLEKIIGKLMWTQLENLDNSNNLQSASFPAANSSAYGASKWNQNLADLKL